MDFMWPGLLPLLAAIPLLVVIYIWAQRRRSKFAVRFSSISLVKEAMGKGPGIRRHIPPFFFLLGITTLILAAARPEAYVTLLKDEATVILAIDVSGSMRANDIKPTRIEAAKAAAREFVSKQDPSTRIGIVAFSGTAAIVQAPTTDHDAAIAAIDRLYTQRSTAIGSAILTSLDAIFGTDQPPSSVQPNQDEVLAPDTPTPTPVPQGFHNPATIVLLTDGQSNTGPRPVDAARQAADRGVRVFTVGVGTVSGAVLQGGGQGGFNNQGGFGGGGFRGGGGGGGFRASLDEPTLKQVASMTGAEYYLASDANALLNIYRQLSSEVVMRTEKTEVTVFLAAIATVFMLIASALSLLWFNRLP